jgi:hypothetical protein
MHKWLWTVVFMLVALAPTRARARLIVVPGAHTRVRDGIEQGCGGEDLNATPFEKPSAAHPWGTVLAACIRDADPMAPEVAVLREWDLFTGRSFREVELKKTDGNQVRVAATRFGVLAVVSDAMGGDGDDTLFLLDRSLRVVHRWSLPIGSFAGLDASGDLGAVTLRVCPQRGCVAYVAAVDLVHSRLIHRTFKTLGKSYRGSWGRALHPVRVVGKNLVVAVNGGRGVRLLRLSAKLRVLDRFRILNPRVPDPGIIFEPEPKRAWLAVARRQIVFGLGTTIRTLDFHLRHVRWRQGPRPADYSGGALADRVAARWAIDPSSARVATETGALAPGIGAPFTELVRYTHPVAAVGLKRAVYADRTRSVFWAFGRVVIVRCVPGLGITVIEPK